MAERSWTVAEPGGITFEDEVATLQVRLAGGMVNVVGVADGPSRLEVSELDGPSLAVTAHDGTLTVGYEDMPGRGLFGWLDRRSWRRRAVVSLAVPPGTRVTVSVVSAEAVISGVTGRTSVQSVSGDATLVGLPGRVDANTVSGNVEAHALSGDLRVNTVSGDLTVIEGTGPLVKAESVSGNMVLDLDPSAGADVQLHSVSGEIAVRIPEPGDARVDAGTNGGPVSCAFEELCVSGVWGNQRITGRLGEGRARLRANTVSGAVALLRRPPLDPAEGVALRKDS